ncbi:E3 ubiquitin-protein ligase TRIM33-like [Mercenaria mercenaria]|uniref:E3 ubiquitin-protein ligase TRIM33-like n=1 Tax=Mercenaria mercenaria TaxID=6596 RepID=UPI00234F0799|nr:E3 ubiquitin-protein ligase TRIM33-like [Mercenaria mercenaria]
MAHSFEDNNTFPGLPDNFINCPICRKTLRAPKCLPCLHSFCMNCLNKHIMTSENKDKSFPCPVCQETTTAPEGNLKPDEWAKHFKSNTLVDSVMDAVDLKKGERKCDPCKNTHKLTIAFTWCTSCREALCPTCTNSHRGLRLTRGHALIDINRIKSQPVAAIIKDEKCPDHEDQFMQYYCKDHKQQCCPVCAVAVHRRCENVFDMAKLGKEIRTQQKGERLLKRLHACLDAQQEMVSRKGNARDALGQKKHTILKEIRDLKTSLTELLSSMETTFLNEFDSLHKSRIVEILNTIEEGQRVVKAICDTTAMLEAAMTHGSDSQLFITFEKIKDECRRFEKLAVTNNKEPKEIVYTFKMDERLKFVANTVRKFGHLSVENDHNPSKVMSFKDASVRETEIFGARAPFDDLRAVDVFPNGDIIIGDRMSKSVLLFHSNGDFVCHTNFKARPWGVAVLGVRTACVSLPECQEIHILKSSLSERTLEDYKTIETGISCFALSNFSGEYLSIQHQIEKSEKGRVQMAQSDKLLHHKVAVDITANHENVQGIAFDEATNKIFIATDFDAVECYSARGRILFRNTYTGDGDFRGMCVDRQSNVYVTSHANKGVLQLSNEGERIRMISTSPLAPLDVAISPRGNKMVVVGRSDLVYVYTFR